MRTVLLLIVLTVSSLSACSLYFDEEGEQKGTLGGNLDAGAKGGCASSGSPDGGIDCDGSTVDGGSSHPDGGAYPDAGVYPDGGVKPDADLVDGGAPDAP
jgi:hypothetical protein